MFPAKLMKASVDQTSEDILASCFPAIPPSVAVESKRRSPPIQSLKSGTILPLDLATLVKIVVRAR